ncbi:hypothetical protein BKA61DRAFT_612924 [Leptodontidium sp. MPI-SDFR-AT-0119]|nr:hypothetical protein BKA61DRAFT_612924 [Leptodontidium sp. MPI-SDFR-AT-0119]
MSAARDEGFVHVPNGIEDMYLTAPSPVSSVVGISAVGIASTDVDQPTRIDDGDLYNSSPVTRNRLGTRNNLKRTVTYEESDDEGGPIRSISETAKRQKLKIPQAKPKDIGHHRIGHHTAEPLIAVFAKLKKLPGPKQCHVYSRQTDDMPKIFPSGKCWWDHVHRNSQVHLEDVTLDSEVFHGFEGEFQDMRIDRKRELVLEYLSALVVTPAHEPAEDTQAPTPVRERTPSYSSSATPFVVGFHEDDLEVPVRAQLRLQYGNRVAAVLFRLDPEDVSKSLIHFPRISVHETKVKFMPEFARPTIEETKAEILSRFLAKDNKNDDEEVATTPKRPSKDRSKSRSRRSRIRSSRGVAARRVRVEIPNESAGDIDEALASLQDIGQTYLNTAFEYGEKLKKRESAVLEKETLLAERESVVMRKEGTIEEEISIGVEAALSAEEDSLEALKEEKLTMQKRIEQLETQLEEARKQPSSIIPAQATTSHAAIRSSSTSSLFLNLKGIIFSEAYRRIPEQIPNAGWYLEVNAGTVVHNDGPLQGKKFTRNQVLQPINGITVPGKLKDVTLRCGGIEYLHYEENGISKLVQNSESVVQHEGQYYVCWTYLREIEEQDFKF